MAPTKTTYEAGEDFNASGMVVTAHYVDAADNTHTKDVVLDNGDLTISPSSSLTAGTTSVTISYGGQSTTQAITVTAPIAWVLKSIAVTTEPDKTTYTAGETFDPAGMVVTATYENSNNTAQTKQEVIANSDLSFSPSTSTALTTSDDSITISFGGKSTTQAITVGSLSWHLVTDASTLAVGDLLIIVSEGEGKAAGAISNQIMGEVAVTVSNHTITSLPSGVVQLTLGGTSGAWTLTNSSSQLLGATAVKKLAWGNGTTTWSISISGGDATIQNGTETYGRFLHNVTSTRFTTYTSNTSTSMLLPQIYRYE